MTPKVYFWQIPGVNGMTKEQLKVEIARGGKFVVYEYCFSFLFVTFHRNSDIYFVQATEDARKEASLRAFFYSALSFLLGWWAIPYGPSQTISTIKENRKGGINVTKAVMNGLPLVEQPVLNHNLAIA